MSYSPMTDKKWQKRWEQEGLADFNPDRLDKKLYCLEMFSYPSGSTLHIGHWYNYSLTDSWARMKKMQGYEVFQPMGFDAFGLPAENYAIKTGIHPKDSTEKNIDTMKQQLKEMGGMFNWKHTLATCQPEYYRWNQWLFLQLLKRGLAYRKKAPVNWCPSCHTVLANEQVLADGSCERCGTLVEKKKLTQWFFKITDYAEELLEDIDGLDWPEKTKKIQKHWIGRSEGAEIVFGVEKDGETVKDKDGKPLTLTVFTTRADTLMGVSYLVIAPDSDLLDLVTTEQEREKVAAYREKASHLSEIDRQSLTREKTGVFTGSYAVHPVSGKKVPLWTADYVIASYGTGVVMAVPAHDERDFAFASRYDLPITEVICGCHGEQHELPYCEDGMTVNSAPFDHLPSDEARHKIVSYLQDKGLARMTINYRLRDWLVSRQRYWGTPIPVVYCEHCGMVPLPEDQLPLELPYDVEFLPDGQSPLAKCESFMNCSCPQCGGPARRDPDTLDTFVDSSWYPFRYVDPHNDHEIFDREKVDALCPVDMYVGGAEHAAMHLLYIRFMTKVLRDMGLVHFDEPVKKLLHQGTILGPDGQKMSKSLGNTILPDPYIERYGSDVFRLYLAFGFSYVDGGPWSDDGIRAISRFLARMEALIEKYKTLPHTSFDENKLTASDKELLYSAHYTIQQVTRDAERFQFNTSVARMMELLNAIQLYDDKPEAKDSLRRFALETLILLLAPFAPHFCEEAHEQMGGKGLIFREEWPQADEKYLVKNEVEVAVQVNGKIVDRVMAPAAATREELLDFMTQLPAYPDWIRGRSVIKSIAVPGRLVNFVVK